MLGIVIKKVSDNQNHVGILYKVEENKPVQLLHLAFHFIFRQVTPNNKYVWLDCGLDQINKASLAAFCAEVYKVNGRDSLPFGIDISGRCFDRSTGLWSPGSPNDGLTCATFVMEIFAAQGHDFLDIERWENRDSDAEWQRYIIGKLVEHGASSEHIEHNTGQIGAFRFRPEEVAGAVPQEEYPVTFTDAKSYAQEILAVLDAYEYEK